MNKAMSVAWNHPANRGNFCGRITLLCGLRATWTKLRAEKNQKKIKNMNLSRRKRIGFSLLAILLVSLCSIPYLWQNFYYHGPRAAFYELASALESGDKNRLTQLTDDGVQAELDKLAKPYGEIEKFGRYLRQSPKASPAIHMVATVDVFATVQNREIMFMFTRRRGRWVAITVFFTNR